MVHGVILFTKMCGILFYYTATAVSEKQRSAFELAWRIFSCASPT